MLEINKNTELDDDWQWLQDNCFEFKDYYKQKSVEFVCEIFKQKWINNNESMKSSDYTRIQEFAQFRHTSPIIVQIFDQISQLLNKVDNLNNAVTVEQINKNMIFLDIFIRNRLNLIIVHQIHGFASLFELLKYFSSL